jgi:HD-GYP domain-containing protein (c-di-GMP phosphodiesterase class II)
MPLKKDKIIDILKITEDINHIRDIDSLLDRILTESRYFTNSEAGSIYLVKGNKLSFEYIQNESLMQNDYSSNRHIYAKREMDINNKSLAGYVALTKKTLAIDDAYKIKPQAPYSFNQSYDHKSSFRTRSILTVPLITSRNKIIGILQVINAKDQNGTIVPFSENHKLLATHFASQAAIAIEKAQMTREMILRMINMAELRDPKETGSHVNRVGAYSIEIYHRWALNRGIPLGKIRKIKDLLRIAAMLHDIGKIGVSDAILKKREELTHSEFEQIKMHTILGARLFKDTSSDWDDMAVEVALNHHERWDGKGYPGFIKNIYDEKIRFRDGKRGEEIPITARIVALSDVYDALVSKRYYKKSWEEKDILSFIKKEKGGHFDPEVVDAFFSIYDIIKAIREKYPHV